MPLVLENIVFLYFITKWKQFIMKKIFLIGGGEINKKETIKIDKDIIKKSGGNTSRILFFPTAAKDSDEYIKNFIKYFSFLGCNNIQWAKMGESLREIKEKIKEADLIYLGGGKTNFLIKAFKQKGLTRYLQNFLNRGGVLAGVSAGAMVLGEISIISEIENDLKFASGFGILPQIICFPHYQKKYKNKLHQLKMQFPNKLIIGIPEKSAVYIKGQKIIYYGQCYKL